MRVLAISALTLVLASATPGLAVAQVGVSGSVPAAGAVVDAIAHVDVTFTGPVDIPTDGATLVSPNGTVRPAGPAEPLPDGAIRVPVPQAGAGLHVLSLTGVDEATGDPVSASVPYAVGTPIGTLDTAKATSASSGAELGRALAVVALVTALGVLIWALLRVTRARRDDRPAVVPLRPLLVAAGVVALIGAAIGVWMAVRGASVASAAGVVDLASGSALAVWSLVVAVLGVALIVAGGRVWRGVLGYGLGLVLAVGALAALGGVATAELPQPVAGDVELRSSLDSGVQASLKLSPAAVGRNTATVVLGGLPRPAEQPILVVRPLDGRVSSMFFPLTATDDAFSSASVVLPFPGRWRAEIRGVPGITPDDPAVFDFDVQPNAGAFDGSGS